MQNNRDNCPVDGLDKTPDSQFLLSTKIIGRRRSADDILLMEVDSFRLPTSDTFRPESSDLHL